MTIVSVDAYRHRPMERERELAEVPLQRQLLRPTTSSICFELRLTVRKGEEPDDIDGAILKGIGSGSGRVGSGGAER